MYFKDRQSAVFYDSVAGLFFTFISVTEAHSSLKETYPKGNAVLGKSPSTIEVWFQDPVVIHPDSLKVFDSEGEQIPTTKSELNPKDARHIITKLKNELVSGKYTVTINVIAQDGYVIEEEFRFTLQESAQTKFEELELLKSNISDGETHKGSPKQIELWFNQPAEVTAFGMIIITNRLVQNPP